MRLIALKGFAGTGKSTLGRALSRHLGCPLIDKDDIKDILDGSVPDAGGLAYEIMFSVARRQLLQGFSVVCDSPLSFHTLYNTAHRLATETGAQLAVIECRCSDEGLWRERINARKALALHSHHQTDWVSFQTERRRTVEQTEYEIAAPHLVVDTGRPLPELLAQVASWLDADAERLR